MRAYEIFKKYWEYIEPAIKDMNRKFPYYSLHSSVGKLHIHWTLADGYNVSITFNINIENDDMIIKKAYSEEIHKYLLRDVKRNVENAIAKDEDGNPYISETGDKFWINRAK